MVDIIVPGMTILRMRALYPNLFYKQSWYDIEEFANTSINIKGDHILGKGDSAPPAAVCVWHYIYRPTNIWKRYIWTSDYDKDGNRIYVGGCNEHKGFQIHRHLINPKVYGIGYQFEEYNDK